MNEPHFVAEVYGQTVGVERNRDLIPGPAHTVQCLKPGALGHGIGPHVEVRFDLPLGGEKVPGLNRDVDRLGFLKLTRDDLAPRVEHASREPADVLNRVILLVPDMMPVWRDRAREPSDPSEDHRVGDRERDVERLGDVPRVNSRRAVTEVRRAGRARGVGGADPNARLVRAREYRGGDRYVPHAVADVRDLDRRLRVARSATRRKPRLEVDRQPALRIVFRDDREPHVSTFGRGDEERGRNVPVIGVRPPGEEPVDPVISAVVVLNNLVHLEQAVRRDLRVGGNRGLNLRPYGVIEFTREGEAVRLELRVADDLESEHAEPVEPPPCAD